MNSVFMLQMLCRRLSVYLLFLPNTWELCKRGNTPKLPGSKTLSASQFGTKVDRKRQYLYPGFVVEERSGKAILVIKVNVIMIELEGWNNCLAAVKLMYMGWSTSSSSSQMWLALQLPKVRQLKLLCLYWNVWICFEHFTTKKDGKVRWIVKYRIKTLLSIQHEDNSLRL